MAKRAMDSKTASMKKTSGHKNEEQFADAIRGRIQASAHTDKKDVIDRQDRAHSVKAGTWWQIFLYGEERLKTNTIFQGIVNVANIMVDCLNAYPPSFAEYQKNKQAAKKALRPHMRALLAELQKPNIFKAFLDKALFDGGKADVLSMYPSAANDPQKKHFHIFQKDEVINALQNDVTLANSKARNENETSEQKPVLKSKCVCKQIGKIEYRHDSQQHYREMKFRLNAPAVMKILLNSIKSSKQLKPNVTVYGKATRLMKS